MQRVIADQRPVAHVAKELGVSRQCAHRWVARFHAEGVAGLADRSSRPHASPRRTSQQAEESVLATRRQLRCGPAGIAAATGVPARTVTRVLTRHRMPRLAECDPLTGERIRASKTTAVRYERSRPGELVHMDVKKIARIPDGGGWKAVGRDRRETTRDRKIKIGYDYIHCLVDDHSRLAYAEVLPDEQGPTCAAFLTRAAAYFADHGITRIERLLTDNAWAYKWSLRDICADLGIRQKFIRPHCPWQNGKAERFNRTLATEWAYRRPYPTNDHRTAALTSWLQHYNHHRAHTALDGQPPITRALTPT